MYSVLELSDLEEEIREELETGLPNILSRLNRTGEIEKLLNLLGLEELSKSNKLYNSYRDGKIIIIGESEIPENTIKVIGKDFGIDKDRFLCYLNYEDGKKFVFRNIQWNPNYSMIMVGPMGHSGIGKGDYSSVITAIESEEGFPPIVRLGSNKLKITKSDFKKKLQEAINSGFIE